MCVSLSAWGGSGPWRGRRGFDSIVQAVSGMAHDSGDGVKPRLLPVSARALFAEMDAPDGRIRYLAPVVRLSETAPRWSRPPVPLGYHEPAWLPRDAPRTEL